MKSQKLQKMVVTAVMLAMATALSLVKIFQMPLGGSVTLLSMLPIVMISIEYGVPWGLVSAFLYSLIQLSLDFGAIMGWGLTPFTLIGSIVFDYLVAYTVIGIAGIFRKGGSKGICIGILIALSARLVSHIISGCIFFAAACPENWNVFLYSICYNGAYMLPEMVFTMIASVALFKLPQIKKIMDGGMTQN
jgi:thiamine transporter